MDNENETSYCNVPIRHMNESEIETVYSIFRENGMFSVSRDEVLRIHQYAPYRAFVAALESGEILGACLVYMINRNVGGISGFAVRKQCDCPNYIQRLLFEFACHYLKDMVVEFTVPAEMWRCIHRTLLIYRWKIALYVLHYENMKILEKEDDSYDILTISGTYKEPFLFHYDSSKGVGRTMLDVSTANVVWSFKLKGRCGDEVAGYGALRKNFENEWTISPLYACNTIASRRLLKKMIATTELKENDKIFVYAVENHEQKTGLLHEQGFVKFHGSAEWYRFSKKNLDLGLYGLWDHTILGLCCPFQSFV